MKKTQTVHILTLIVDNEFGVLTRITAQIRREGWNIQSLAVAECLDPGRSRITLSLECFDTTLPNVLHRLSRLACVHDVTACDLSLHVCRELVLVGVAPGDVEKARAVAAEWGATALTRPDGTVFFELAGEPLRLSEFVRNMQSFENCNIVRTGPIVLE